MDEKQKERRDKLMQDPNVLILSHKRVLCVRCEGEIALSNHHAYDSSKWKKHSNTCKKLLKSSPKEFEKKKINNRTKRGNVSVRSFRPMVT